MRKGRMEDKRMQQLIGLVKKNFLIVVALVVLAGFMTGTFTISEPSWDDKEFGPWWGSTPFVFKDVTYNGEVYNFKGYSDMVSVAGDGVVMTYGLSDGQKNGYLRKSISPLWTEVLVDYEASATHSSSVPFNCNGHATLLVGGMQYGSGGFNVGSTCKNVGTNLQSGTLRLVKTSTTSANLYNNGVFNQVVRVTEGDDYVYFMLSIGNNADSDRSGSSSATLKVKSVTVKTPVSITPPIPPLPPVFSDILDRIKAWFSGLFSNLFSITGSSDLTLPESSGQLGALIAGQALTYNVVLQAPSLIDEKFEDGTYSVRYCTAGMVRKDGTIHSSTVPERCSDVWTKTFETTVPSKLGDYAVVAIMTENKGVFDEAVGAWKFGSEEVIAQDALNVKTKAPIPNASQLPQAGFFSKFVSGLLNWFKGIFGG